MKLVITTAIELSAAQLKSFTQDFEKKLGKVSVEAVVDPTIIGGIKVRVGSKTFDASLKTKLNKVKEQLNLDLTA